MILQRLNDCFSQVLRHAMPENFAEAEIATLPNWDSVAHLSLMMEIEREFKFRFTATELFSVTTIPALLAIIEERSHA